MNTSALAFLSSEFYDTKKNSSTYITRSKEKKRKIVGEENGLDPERVHARHLDLRLTRLSNAPLQPSRFQPVIFKALTFQALIRYSSFELFCFCKIDFFI